MRMSSSRVAGLAVLAAISTLLLTGCQLREGASSEYGDYGMPSPISSGQFGMGNN
jgi:hypothetical protein